MNSLHKVIPREDGTFARPHNVNPCLSSIRVILTVKNFSGTPGVCHLGLNCTASMNMKMLRMAGIHVECWQTKTAADLQRQLLADRDRGGNPITHVIVSSPAWIFPTTADAIALTHGKDKGPGFFELCNAWPEIEFVLQNHSGCAYLSIDKYGIRNTRAVLDLALDLHNLRVSANNGRVTGFLNKLAHGNVLYLPNLYDWTSFVTEYTAQQIGDTLRVGSFGASRPWKNQLLAAEGAFMLAKAMGLKLELYVNSKRPDGGERMIESREELFDKLPGCKLIDIPWQPWPTFRKTIASTHLSIQASFDETFDVCAADSFAVGVPCITSPSIEWSPGYMQCDTCDPASVMRVGLCLLNQQHTSIADARRKLKKFVIDGVDTWLHYLLREPPAY